MKLGERCVGSLLLRGHLLRDPAPLVGALALRTQLGEPLDVLVQRGNRSLGVSDLDGSVVLTFEV